jgi:hypothetical protein
MRQSAPKKLVPVGLHWTLTGIKSLLFDRTIKASKYRYLDAYLDAYLDGKRDDTGTSPQHSFGPLQDSVYHRVTFCVEYIITKTG